jgi:hypothetical protein
MEQKQGFETTPWLQREHRWLVGCGIIFLFSFLRIGLRGHGSEVLEGWEIFLRDS